MKTIFKNADIVVLSFEEEKEYIIRPGACRAPSPFIISAEWRRNYNLISHLPMFKKKKYYIELDNEKRWFIPLKSVCGLCYRQEDGSMSDPYIATFCKLEGEKDDCVILGCYSQSCAQDELDDAGPFDELPTGVCWRDSPKVFRELDEKSGKEQSAFFKLIRVSEYANEYLCK